VKNIKGKAVTALLVLVCFVSLVSGGWAASAGSWTAKAALPQLRADLPAVGYSGLVYVFGGYHDSSTAGQAEVFAYNPSADSWTEKTSMTYARWGAAAAIYSDHAYVFGGSDAGVSSNKVEAYSFSSDSWVTKQDLPDELANQGLEAVTAGPLIYLFYGPYTYAYNPLTDTYAELAAAPFAKDWAECAYVNVAGEDRIYILGGFDFPTYGAVDSCAYYRPAYDDWITIDSAPYAAYGTLRDDPVVNGIIYYGYGQGPSSFYSYLYSFNPSTEVWTQLPSGVYPRDGVGCGLVGGMLYVIGGRDSWSNPLMGLNYNEQFDTGALTASISPTQVRMYINQTQTFTASILGGTSPYTYIWHLNGSVVSGAWSSSWTFAPTQIGHYNVYVTVTDSLGNQVQSNFVNDIAVYGLSQASPLVPDWSYVTQDFFRLVPGENNPVLTGTSVTDRTADFVADPFMFHENNTYYMFFEVGEDAGQYSEIGLATSNDGFTWTYKQIVISEPFAMAYPYVFKWDGNYYLIPETYSENEVRLYEATDFPYSWTYISSIISGQNFIPVDSSIFRYNNTWWMFTGDVTNLYLFYSYNLTNPASWHITPNSPIITNDQSKVRGGGRTIVFDNDRVIRLTQKCDVSYGEAVRAFEVDTLTQTSYAEHEVTGSPLVQASGAGWNSWAMHTIDPWWTGNGWLAAVDGGGDYWWSIGIYVSPLNVTISPVQARLDVNQSQTFVASPLGGTPPYAYQWYKNGTAISGATGSSWIFRPTLPGHYNCYVTVTDSLGDVAQSNIVSNITVYNQPSVSISPVSVNMTVGGTQQFSSSVFGGLAPYSYQWYYANGTTISGSAASNLTYTANSTGTYSIYLNVTDSLNFVTQSNTVSINVNSQPSVTISPAIVKITVGTQQVFNSVVSNGTPPHSYQWYLNGSQVSGANGNNWAFNATSAGTYIVFLRIKDSYNFTAQSNNASVNVESPLSVNVSLSQVKVNYGQSVMFNSSVSGGTLPFSYQWYLNGTAVSGANGPNWFFTPKLVGNYRVYLNVTDAFNFTVESNVVDVVVCSVYLMLTPTSQGSYSRGQLVTFTVDLFNQNDPSFASSLTLTISGQNNYGYFDAQPVNVKLGGVKEYSFDWVVPNTSGTYLVSVGLAPAQLIACDETWLNVS